MRGQRRHDVWPIYAFLNPGSPALEGPPACTAEMLQQKTHEDAWLKCTLNCGKFTFLSLLNPKAVTTGHKTHTHTHTHLMWATTHAQLQILREPPRAALSAAEAHQRVVLKVWVGVKISSASSKIYDGLPAEVAHRHGFETSPALFAGAALSIPPPPHPPLLSLSVTANSPFPILSILVMWLSVLFVERGERVSHEGREKEKRSGEDCKGREKGLYRKSISILHFSDGTDSASNIIFKCLCATKIFSDKNGTRLNFKSFSTDRYKLKRNNGGF